MKVYENKEQAQAAVDRLNEVLKTENFEVIPYNWECGEYQEDTTETHLVVYYYDNFDKINHILIEVTDGIPPDSGLVAQG